MNFMSVHSYPSTASDAFPVVFGCGTLCCPQKDIEFVTGKHLYPQMNTARMFVPGGRRALSTALRPYTRHIKPHHPQKTFIRGATVMPGIFPIHKLPLLTFLRHQSVSPKNAEIEDTRPQIKPRYMIHYTCGV